MFHICGEIAAKFSRLKKMGGVQVPAAKNKKMTG